MSARFAAPTAGPATAPTGAIRAELAALLGPRGYSEDPAVLAPWLSDWRGVYRGRAAALVAPAETEQLVALMRLAARERLAIVPQGGNSSMVGGATPDDSGDALLLSLRRLDAVAFDDDPRHVRCGAGVVLQSLHEACAREGRRFPLTLGGKGSATVGGLISTNAGGTQVLRHGTMRALVAGLEVVTASGALLDLSSPLPKDNRGFDLKQLFIGSEGTLGIVAGALLVTRPALIDRAVAWVALASPTDAWRLLRMLEEEGDLLEGFELLPQAALDAVLRHIPGTRAPLAGGGAWHVLIEWARERPGEPDPRELAERMLAPALASGLARDAVLAKSEAEAEGFWRIRESISEAERAEGPAVQHDISVPVAAMAGFIEQQSRAVEARWPGTRALAFGHLGDGNVHFHVKAPPGADPARWRSGEAAAISAFVYEQVVAAGGSISAEHGIGQAKREELQRLSDPVRLAVMRAVKTALDPEGRLNPGKLLARALAPGGGGT